MCVSARTCVLIHKQDNIFFGKDWIWGVLLKILNCYYITRNFPASVQPFSNVGSLDVMNYPV